MPQAAQPASISQTDSAMDQASTISAIDDIVKEVVKHKEKGNERFKQSDLTGAITEYMQALTITTHDGSPSKNNKALTSEVSAVYKNLAAVYLKQEKWDQVIETASKSLELTPGDCKALYRRAQAYEAIGKLDEAFKDARQVLHIEPNNSAVQQLLNRITIKIQKVQKEQNSLSNRINQMVDILKNDSLDDEKRVQAATNMIVLCRDRAGAELAVKNNCLQLFNALMKKHASLRLPLLRALSELAKDSEERTKLILQEIGVPRLINYTERVKDEQFLTAFQYTLQTLIDALFGKKEFENIEKKIEKSPDKTRAEWEKRRREHELAMQIMARNSKELDAIMISIIKSVNSHIMAGEPRDCLLEVLMKNCDPEMLNYGKKLVEVGGLFNLMEVAGELEDLRYESSMEITSATRTHVAAVLGRIYDAQDTDKDREEYRQKIREYIDDKLKGPNVEDKVRVTACIIALLQGPLEVGNSILGTPGVIEMMLAMAGSEEEVQQKLAAEAIIAAATKKDKCTSIISMGGEILKRLYKSSNDHIKVRALVGLCKLGSVGGDDASVKPFGEGSTLKLSSLCRKFLLNPMKDKDIRRWAAEGLAYLTLDADVKEELVNDKDALKALLEMARIGGPSCLYGVATTLVNLCNCHEKKEVMPEMVELAKFAKQHIPEDHPKDAKEFVDNRIRTLAQNEVTVALVALHKTESKTIRELISRIFNAICEFSDLRGAVVQQGGAKALLNLAIETNTSPGKLQAGQALARIAITIDPTVAFPGQRSCEVVRPIKELLHPECKGIQNFEALMALTNLAQVSPSVQKAVIKDGGVTRIEQYMYEEHEMLKRAATQCMVNLITAEEVVKIYEGENDRVKYLVILGEDDDIETAKAASGALAMLTAVSSKACEKVFEAKRWLTILIELISSSDRDFMHRGVAIVRNMIMSGEKVAEKLVETPIFELLTALIRPEVDDVPQPIKDLAKEALDKAQEYNLIRPANN